MNDRRSVMRKAVAVVVVACIPFAALGGDGEPRFSHEFHVGAGVTCGECHVQGASPDGIPVVSSDSCAKCHDDGRAALLLGDDAAGHPGEGALSHAGKVSAFPHGKHADAMECTVCHQPAGAESAKGEAPLQPTRAKSGSGEAPYRLSMDRERCSSCHEELGIEISGGECSACHGMNMRRQRPGDHRGSTWRREHGHESEWRDPDDHGAGCTLCHTRSSCKACHQKSKPSSHTGLWRARMHGIEAGWDRTTCKTCHETSACIRCHKQTRPMNHVGSWGKLHGLAAKIRDNRHCLTCHSTGQCAACHKGR